MADFQLRIADDESSVHSALMRVPGTARRVSCRTARCIHTNDVGARNPASVSLCENTSPRRRGSRDRKNHFLHHTGNPTVSLDSIVRRSDLQSGLLNRVKKGVGQMTGFLMRITNGLAMKGNNR